MYYDNYLQSLSEVQNYHLTPSGYAIDSSQPGFPKYHRKFANPAPLGLMGFATTSFLNSLFGVHARNAQINNVVVGPSLIYGGLIQILAGIWECASGNTFGATTFSTYGAYWISNGIVLLPGSGIKDAYLDEQSFNTASAFLNFAFMIQTTLLFIASLKSSIAISFVLFLVIFIFLFSGIYELTGNESAGKASGVFGLLASFGAWYAALGGLSDTCIFTLPLGDINTLLSKKTQSDSSTAVDR